MKNTVKLAVLGAAALAASSSVALAASELPNGALTGLALGAPLPEGVYAVHMSSYGSAGSRNLAYSAPLWLYWSTPWQIAGGRVSMSTYTGVAELWNSGSAPIATSFMNTLVEGGLSWNLRNGFNVGLHAGAWLPSTQVLPQALGRDYTAFQGIAVVSYIANGWDLTALVGYGSGGGGDYTKQVLAGGADTKWQPASVSIDLTVAKKMGKFETGSIAYGSWDQDGAKEEHFALGGLVGYDFGSFVAQAKLGTDVYHSSIHGRSRGDDAKETRGWLTIVKPLWNPPAESLK